MDHGHVPLAVPASAAVPALSLELEQDPMSGFNLRLLVQRYQLRSPPADLEMAQLMSAGEPDSAGYLEGHAHLYVNGQKVGRLYGTSVHIPASLLREGSNEITVTLNNHGHMYWTVAGQQVLATIFLEPGQTPFVRYQFASFPADSDALQGSIVSSRSPGP